MLKKIEVAVSIRERIGIRNRIGVLIISCLVRSKEEAIMNKC